MALKNEIFWRTLARFQPDVRERGLQSDLTPEHMTALLAAYRAEIDQCEARITRDREVINQLIAQLGCRALSASDIYDYKKIRCKGRSFCKFCHEWLASGDFAWWAPGNPGVACDACYGAAEKR